MAKDRLKKPKRSHNVSVFSSSDEVVEINGCQKQLESPEQTTGNGKSCVQMLKGKRALLCTSENSTDSECTQLAKTSIGSVDGVSTRSQECYSSIPNSVSSVKGKTHIEKRCAKFCKKELDVQLICLMAM